MRAFTALAWRKVGAFELGGSGFKDAVSIGGLRVGALFHRCGGTVVEVGRVAHRLALALGRLAQIVRPVQG